MHIPKSAISVAHILIAITLCLSLSVMVLVGVLFPLSTPVSADNPFKPIVFVHGSGGSGAQFESQSMRFTSNGYPQNLLFAFEYDTSTPGAETQTQIAARLDTYIDSVLASTGADKVYLLGHSRGTYVDQEYLSVPARAAKVAKYVNLDGQTAAALPGGVPTLALFATRGWSYNPANKIVGATNVFIPNQTHVQLCTSAESFVEMYKFFLGFPPATSQIVPEPCGSIKLAGRAILYPQGTGVGDGTVDVWETDSATGARIGTSPKATYTVSGNGFYDGNWGPFNGRCGVQYEFVINRAGYRPHHFYFEPFVRSDYFVRLLTSANGGIGDLMQRDNRSAALVINRNKEFWGNDSATNDALTLNGSNIITPATCPVIKVPGSTGVIGIFAYDKNLDMVDNLTGPISTFFAVGFMTGIDKYMAASDPPNGTISLVLTPRGGGGGTQRVNIQNWASLTNSVSVPFMDFYQTYGSNTASVNTDLGSVNFTTSAGTISGLTNLPASSLPCSAGGFIFPFGMFSYSIGGLAPGGTSYVTIKSASPIPLGSKIFKCQSGNLVDFTQYAQQPDTNTFILTLKDGGQGDADGAANGIIVDPCGPAYSFSGPPQSSSAQVNITSQAPVAMANITVQSASLSTAKVAPGAPVTVTANVANKGTAGGSAQINLYVNGQQEAHQGVTMGSGAMTPVKFTVSRDEPGTYSVYVGSVPAGTFEVDTFADPNIVLYISGALILLALLGGVIFMATKRR